MYVNYVMYINVIFIPKFKILKREEFLMRSSSDKRKKIRNNS